MLFFLLPMMLIKFLVHVSLKLLTTVPGLTVSWLLFVYKFYYTMMFFLYIYFTGERMIKRALQFNRKFHSRLGMHFAISVHAFWFLVLSRYLKYNLE
jgi:hypothetical protein